MTGRNLYLQLKQFGDLDVSEANVISWIDMGQKKASLDLPVVQTVVVMNVVVGTVTPIATGVFKLVSATYEDGEYPLSSIKVMSNSMIFDLAADSVTVVYTSIAPDYTDLSDELTIHPSLHAPFVYFLISMYYDMEGEGDSEESSLAERYYQRWIYYRNLAIAALMGTDNETYTREPISTTDVLPKSSRFVKEDYFE